MQNLAVLHVYIMYEMAEWISIPEMLYSHFYFR